jgi:hypothetical protein
VVRNRMALTSLTGLAILGLLAGCSSEPEKPKRRALVESQVRVYTDRVLADMGSSADPLERANALSEPEYMRSAIEKEGRAMCSHIIAGVSPRGAFQSAYPQAPIEEKNRRWGLTAADVMCPEQED